MSLYSKLGPQGKTLLERTERFSNNIPQALDYLIEELRNPKSDTTVSKVLGYLYNYLPTIKVEYNLRLVISAFLNSPVCFALHGPSFIDNYLIIEAFKSITDRKLAVSQPTIPIKTWYKILFHELDNFSQYDMVHNSWKVLPIVSGVMLSNQLRDDLYVNTNMVKYLWFFRDFDNKLNSLFVRSLNYSLTAYNSDDIINLSLLSFSIMFKHEKMSVKDYTPTISNKFIINKLIQLMYSKNSFEFRIYQELMLLDPQYDLQIVTNLMNNPVIKHLNRLSFLLENYFQVLDLQPNSFNLIWESLIEIKQFNQNLCEQTQTSKFNTSQSQKSNNPLHQQFWILMKSILFSQCIIYQGIYSRFLKAKNGYMSFRTYNIDQEYKEISFKVLESLYYLNYVLVSIGQGGFDTYNFTYYLSLEVILKNFAVEFERFTMFLIGYPNVNLNSKVLNENFVIKSKVLFVMGLWENYLQNNHVNNDFTISTIFPLCLDIVNNSDIKAHDLIEACHSVLLLYFSNHNKEINIGASLDYINLVVSQFPAILSPHQLSVAIETLGKSILTQTAANALKSRAEEMLNFIYFKCLHTKNGIYINPQNKGFHSAQPISEIAAESTLRTFDSKHNDRDIIHDNKRKKPSKQIMLDLIPDSHQAYKFEKRLTPETSKEAMVLTIINLVPYLPLSIFTRWLDKVFILIEGCDKPETIYLLEMLWKVISENLDLNRGELAIRWWYSTKKAVAHSLVKETVTQNDLKL